MKKVVFLSVMGMALLSCCSQKKNAAEGNAVSKTEKMDTTIKVLNQGGYGGRQTAGNVVITSRKELISLYSELKWDNVPDVDFTKNNVVALFMGRQSTGGNSISISNLTIEGNTAFVTVEKKYPEGAATMALTEPYYVAAITKTEKVVFK